MASAAVALPMALSMSMSMEEGSNQGLSLDSHPALSSLLSLANSDEGKRWHDITLLDCEGGAHRAHRLLLAAHSRFLHRVLHSHDRDRDPEDNVITLAGVSGSAVRAALAFVYRGEVSDSLEEARQALELVAGEAQSSGSVQQSMQVEVDVAVSEGTTSTRPKRKRIRNKRLDQESYELPMFADTPDMNAIKDEPFLAEEDYSCCGTEFLSMSELEAHKKSYGCELTGNKSANMPTDEDQTGAENSSSMFLSTKTRTRTSRRTRIRKVGNKENLRCCDTEFENEIVYTSHKVVGHEEQPDGNKFLICCDEKISGNFKVHLQSSHKLDDVTEKAKCCDNTYEGLLDLTRHCTETHGLRLSQYKRMICCATTLRSFDEWMKHKEGDDAHIECNYCAFISKDQRHLSMHMYSKHKVGNAEEGKDALTCKHCKQEFKGISERQEHEDRHDDSFKYSCGSCSKEFKLMSSLKTHMYRLGKQHNLETKEYSCDFCSKIFSTVSARRKHLRSDHQKKENYNCDDCDQIFMDKHRLVTHKKVRHLKVKDIQCTWCGKLFATQERMRIHEKFVHVVDNEKVPCDICFKEFVNKDRMIDHRRSVHRDRKYQCESCGSTFKNSSTLKSHVVSIHLAHDKKPLRCGTCGKGFLHDSRLRAHEIIHNDKAPYSCKYCGRPNKCKNNNLKHEKRCKKGGEPQAMVVPVQGGDEENNQEITAVAIAEAEVMTA